MGNLNKNNGAASAALWWMDTSLDGLIQRNFHVAEVANMGHMDYRGIDINEAIKKFKAKNIQMIGTTDWHGWGYQSYIWTAVNIPNWENMDYSQKNIALIDALEGKYKTRVLEYRTLNESKSYIRYIFEPFVGIFNLLASQKFLCLLVWFFWIFWFIEAVKFIYAKNKVHFFWLFVFAVNLIMSISFYIQWQDIKIYNKTLNNLGIYFLIVAALSLIVSFISFRMAKKVKK
jgi:hypothetical protein